MFIRAENILFSFETSMVCIKGNYAFAEREKILLIIRSAGKCIEGIGKRIKNHIFNPKNLN